VAEIYSLEHMVMRKWQGRGLIADFPRKEGLIVFCDDKSGRGTTKKASKEKNNQVRSILDVRIENHIRTLFGDSVD
jgi:hypothetical protein